MTWTNLFLYLSIITVIVIAILLIIITIRIKKCNKQMNKNQRDSAVDLIRKTSKYNKQPQKRLKF